MKIPIVKEQSSDRSFMLQTVTEQTLCQVTPRVGAIAVHETSIVAKAHKTGNSLKQHAEQLLLDELQTLTIDLKECVIYVTMEPCYGNDSCSERLKEAGIGTVVIGRYDLNSTHYRKGWSSMNDSGLVLRDFDADLRVQIQENNSKSEVHFMTKTGPEGHGKFSYKHNGNNSVFELVFSDVDPRKILMRGASISKEATQVFCLEGATSLATGAKRFCEIDDPTALDLNIGAWQTVKKGEIAVLCNENGCALLKIKQVNHADKSFNFEFRILPAKTVMVGK